MISPSTPDLRLIRLIRKYHSHQAKLFASYTYLRFRTASCTVGISGPSDLCPLISYSRKPPAWYRAGATATSLLQCCWSLRVSDVFQWLPRAFTWHIQYMNHRTPGFPAEGCILNVWGPHPNSAGDNKHLWMWFMLLVSMTLSRQSLPTACDSRWT